MTALLDRPAPVATPHRGTDARRAIIRWAWRLYRREWRQQVLTLALLVVSVAATIVGLGLVSNIRSGAAGSFGTASTRIDVTLSSPQHAPADIAAAQQVFATTEIISHTSVPVPGSVNSIDLRDQSPDGRFSRPMLRLVKGHYPVAADQIAVTDGAATTFSVRIGSTLSVNHTTYHVVGIVENPKDLGDDFLLVAHGTLSAPNLLTILTNSHGNSVFRTFHPGSDDSVGIGTIGLTDAQQRRAQSLAVLLLATIGLLFVGLLSVAGFTVMAQRRLRALGMIRAIGATDRQVRLVLLANGGSVGIVGAVLGLIVGLLAWFALVPAFEKVVGHRIDPFAQQWWAIAAIIALAVITAVLAAWWPARAAARIPVVTALSGRPAPPRPAHRFAAVGVASTAAGFVLLVMAHQRNTVAIVSGIITVVLGMLLLAPLGIRLIARIGRGAPVATRLALRDLARYQARSGAALAAVSLAVGIAATIAVSASAQSAADNSAGSGNLPSNQLEVWIAGPPGPGGGGPAQKTAAQGAQPISDADLARLQTHVDALAADLHTSKVVPLQVAWNPQARSRIGNSPGFDVVLVKPVSRGKESIGVPFVATPAVLAFYRIPAATMDSADVLTARPLGAGIGVMVGIGRQDTVTPRVRVSRQLPTYSSAPNALISSQYVAAHGLTTRPVGWLLQTAHSLTAAQIAVAEHDAAAAGMAVVTRSNHDRSLQQLRDYSTAAGFAVALAVLAMTVGLVRSETANDLRTLSATGASTRTRRTITAATAGALGVLGGLLGVGGAYLALIAWHWHHVNYLKHVPYLHVAILLIALPLVAAVGGWLAAWRAPEGIAHRPME